MNGKLGTYCAGQAGKLATGLPGGLSGDLPTELPLKIKGKLSIEVQQRLAGGKHWWMSPNVMLAAEWQEQEAAYQQQEEEPPPSEVSPERPVPRELNAVWTGKEKICTGSFSIITEQAMKGAWEPRGEKLTFGTIT